jgi:NAD(P)-dependent dehydrogenase (short-subunit alcohol dehydrogenase family)
MKRLTGRKILITGGTSGIGLATAAMFRTEGAAVVCLDRSAGAWDGGFEAVDVAPCNRLSRPPHRRSAGWTA